MNKIWNWFSLLGVNEELSDETALTILYNRMALFSTIMLILFSIFLFLTQIEILFVYTTFGIALIYAMVLVLNGLDKIYWARFCNSFGTVVWVSLYYICFGGFFSQSLAVGAAVIINYVAFRKKMEYMKLLFVTHVGIYFMALIYGINFEPIVKLVEYPISSLVSFVISMGWVTIILIVFHKEREMFIHNLKLKNEALERTTIELERFSYIASHDLKSPLRTIIGFGGMIKKDIENEQYQEVSKKMDYVITGAKQMNYIIEGILELSQLKSIKKEEQTEINLNDILGKTILNITEEISQSNAVIESDGLPIFMGTEVEFLLLFQNLIQNAIKYNKSKTPTLIISTHQNNGQLFITFKDNGIGINERYFNQIFEFFKRLHTSAQYEGTGIGLGLCKRIVENYNGEITVESQIGKGSSFIIQLPTESK
ncbi:MAG: ATP-binding protein [Saprospiraceae bacterium]